MKFYQFKEIRNSLINKNLISESIKSFNSYREVFEEENSTKEAQAAIDELFNEEINRICVYAACTEDLALEEAFMDTVGKKAKNMFTNMIGFVRLKSMGPKYVKALTDEGAVELDYARRKKAAGKKNVDSANSDSLKAAHDAKKSAIQDRTKAIAEKMDNIASTNYLKALAKQVKLTARMKKNAVLLKIASKEEAAELKLKNAELNSSLQKSQGELRDYEKSQKAQEEDAKDEMIPKMKDEIKRLNAGISEVQGKIDLIESNVGEDAEEDAKKIEAGKKLLPLLQQKADLVSQRAELKAAFNQLSGEDEYNPEEDFKEKGNLEQKAEDLNSRIEKLSAKKGEEETGPTGGEEEREETGPNGGEEESEYADTESGKNAKEIDAKLKDIDKEHSGLKKQLEDLPDIGDMTDEDKQKADEINSKIGKLKNQAKELNREKNEILSGLSKESEEHSPNKKMTFEEYCNRPR